MERALSAALGLAVVFGGAGIGSAKPVKQNTECTCTCVARDADGNRVEGSKTTFTTSGSDCTIGIKVGCYVGDLKGSYAACTGKGIDNPPQGGSAQPNPNPHSGGSKVPVAPGGNAATPK